MMPLLLLRIQKVAEARGEGRAPEEQARQEEAAVKKDAEQRLRSQLGVLIHRKVAALMPDYELLIQRVPTRWRFACICQERDHVSR